MFPTFQPIINTTWFTSPSLYDHKQRIHHLEKRYLFRVNFWWLVESKNVFSGPKSSEKASPLLPISYWCKKDVFSDFVLMIESASAKAIYSVRRSTCSMLGKLCFFTIWQNYTYWKLKSNDEALKWMWLQYGPIRSNTRNNLFFQSVKTNEYPQ